MDDDYMPPHIETNNLLREVSQKLTKTNERLTGILYVVSGLLGIILIYFWQHS